MPTIKVLTASGRGQHRAALGEPAAGLEIADGTLEVLKWLALLMMALDHINKYLLDESSTTLFALGRMVMPLFSFVLCSSSRVPMRWPQVCTCGS